MLRTLTILLLLAATGTRAQQLYFPPNTGTTWDTLSPASLGWCTDSIPPLYDFLEQSNSKAFLVLKDGRMVLEKYFGTFTQDSLWYWASAGKSLTAFLVGKAREDGFLDITDTSAQYLGNGWTSCPPDKEEKITVWHQLTMTSGLDDGNGNVDCTDPVCLEYLADAGTRWAYHNAPYTLLDGVIENATGQTLNAFLFNELTLTTGLTGAYLPIGYNNVMFSTPRNMARFGLLMQAGGTWNGNVVMADTAYLHAMVTPSQALNPAYGYLWWLNGQSSYKLPGFQFDIPGPIMPNAPMDAFNAMGKNGQLINVSPSTGLVVVRVGDLPGGLFVPNLYNDSIWIHLNKVICDTQTGFAEAREERQALPYPNPASDQVRWPLEPGNTVRSVTAVGMDGQRIPLRWNGEVIELGELPPGTYVLERGHAGGMLERSRLSVLL